MIGSFSKGIVLVFEKENEKQNISFNKILVFHHYVYQKQRLSENDLLKGWKHKTKQSYGRDKYLTEHIR